MWTILIAYLVSWVVATVPRGVGKKSPDQVQAAYIGSLFQFSVLVDKLTGHNPYDDVPFFRTIELLVVMATLHPPKEKLQRNLITQPLTV